MKAINTINWTFVNTGDLDIVQFVFFREIRLDIHVLNHEGNVADCAGVAGLAALAHFKRPDVSLEGDIVKVTQHEICDSECRWFII